MKLQQFSAIVPHASEFFCVAMYSNIIAFYSIFCSLHVLDHRKNTCLFDYIEWRVNILKFTNKKFSPRPSCIKILLFSPVHRDFSDVYKMLHVACTYDTNVKHQIWSFCSNFFWVVLIRDTQTQTHTHRERGKQIDKHTYRQANL